MEPRDYPTVASFTNDTTSDLHIHLELIPEEVVLAPGHSIDLLAKPTEGLLPISIDYGDSSLQIHAHKVFDPDWHVRFKGKVIKVGNATHLAEYE